MRTLPLVALLLVSCNADRWFGSVSRGQGEIDGGGKPEGYDTEDYRLEIGLTGPLFVRPERDRRSPCLAPPAAVTPLAPAPAVSLAPPTEDSDIPWSEIITLALTVGGWEASKYGGKKGLPVAKKVAASMRKPRQGT